MVSGALSPLGLTAGALRKATGQVSRWSQVASGDSGTVPLLTGVSTAGYSRATCGFSPSMYILRGKTKG